MRQIFHALLQRWHRTLGLSKQSPPSWYRDRVHEELLELQTAPTALLKLSETSDVLFSISRARYDGFPVHCPSDFLAASHHANILLAYAYMLAKFTSRWAFYRVAACLCGSPNRNLVREVVNPGKDHKLVEVALRYGFDPVEFKRVCLWLRRVWPLLP